MATEELHLLLCRGIPQLTGRTGSLVGLVSVGQAVKRCHGIFGHLWSNMATSQPFFGDKAIVGSTGDGKIGWIWLDITKNISKFHKALCRGKAHQEAGFLQI